MKKGNGILGTGIFKSLASFRHNAIPALRYPQVFPVGSGYEFLLYSAVIEVQPELVAAD
jgi:hypothetical protein